MHTLTSARVLSVTSMTNSRGGSGLLLNNNFKILMSTVAPRLSMFEIKQYSRPWKEFKFLLNELLCHYLTKMNTENKILLPLE